MSDGANDAASALRQLALGQQPITKREECQPMNGVPEDAAAIADRDDLRAATSRSVSVRP
jgi:hypothetical protein